MRLTRLVRQLLLVATLLELVDVLHRISHAPWRCTEDCRWWQIWPERE